MAGPWERYAQAPAAESAGDGPWAKYGGQSASEPKKEYIAIHNPIMGSLKGAADIGATLLRPVDALLNATGITDKTNVERRQQLKDFFSQNADPESFGFKAGELVADVAGTAGAGGVLAKGAQALGAGGKVVNALRSGGLNLGPGAATTAAGRVGDLAIRAGAGAAGGGAAAGLVNPNEVGEGAAIGAALPGALKLA